MSTAIQTSPTRTLPQLDDAGRALLFTEARTANTFADTPVTDEELRSIWDLAKWGPTSANTQPLRVVYVRTPEGKARLVPLMAEGNRAKTASAPAVAVLAVDTRFHEHMPTTFPVRPQMQEMYAGNDALRESAAQLNGSLQAAYFITSVRAHGLAAGPMTGIDATGIDAEFFPDGRFRTLMVVNIGHPGADPWFGRLPRLDHADVLTFA
ncbi:malonic semialdehyde reductase [Modestobacter sp. I12A-02628]|uniref:Malonic semialdehyde reductase n=1 Tax=Goekera deserti TaxID=2497753 RepID=A0A7K3WBG6_9ACTN|nr:malonic semialdehyde reductase [Goekera deserti]MPQ98228.1 malonic semialdehyde reductase [Goekera deserti]NDI48054.1 malonic semialdehyde reductase [Goekera deserti]NEL53802.1 malonic semialdehyde reductase [Goekera deserti]